MKISKITLKLMLAGLLLVLVSGCAGTIPKAKFTQEIEAGSMPTANDEATVKLDAAPDVGMSDMEKNRLAEKIRLSIDGRKALNTKNGKNKLYEVEVLITRYERGDPEARKMLAGLGQIHIDGEVKLLELPDRKQVGAFTIKKTFAWGGAYGGSIKVEDIENTFADGIAASITGQK